MLGRFIYPDGTVAYYWEEVPAITLPTWREVKKMITGNRLMRVTTGANFAITHMLDAEHNESAECIQGSPRDLTYLFDKHKQQGCKYAIMQILVAPYLNLDRDRFLKIVLPLCGWVFGFQPMHAIVFEHVKRRPNGGSETHYHINVSYTNPATNRVNPGWRWSHAKCERISRELEARFEPDNVLLGRRQEAVVAQLRSEGKHDIADQIEAAYPPGAKPENRTPPLAIEQAAKKNGVDLRGVVMPNVRECWRNASNRDEFAIALKDCQLSLAKSDQKVAWAICDLDGNFLSLLTKCLPGVSHPIIISKIGEPNDDTGSARQGQRPFHNPQYDLGAAEDSADVAPKGDLTADRDGESVDEAQFLEALEERQFDGAMDRLLAMARDLMDGPLQVIRRYCGDMIARARQWLDSDINSIAAMDDVTAERYREFIIYADAAAEAAAAVVHCRNELSQLTFAPKPPSVGRVAHEKRIQAKFLELNDLEKKAKETKAAEDEAQRMFEPTWTAWKDRKEKKTVSANRWVIVANSIMEMIAQRPKTANMGPQALYTIAMSEFDRAAAPAKINVEPAYATQLDVEIEIDGQPKPPGVR